jgi:hypothetical protein
LVRDPREHSGIPTLAPAADLRAAFWPAVDPAGVGEAGDPLPQPTTAQRARQTTTAAKGNLRILIGRWCGR